LKRTGFGKRWSDGSVSVDWSKLTAYISTTFFDRMRAAPEAEVVFSDPPQKQVLSSENVLSWKATKVPIDNATLLGAVRTIRNNLFHGGKLPSVPGTEPARNEALLQAGLFVIEQLLGAHPELDEAFRSA